jgi:hypothetical protein
MRKHRIAEPVVFLSSRAPSRLSSSAIPTFWERKHQSQIAAQQPLKEIYETPAKQVVRSHPYRHGFPLRRRSFSIRKLRGHDRWPTHQPEWFCTFPVE